MIFDPSGIPFAAASAVMANSWASSNKAVAQRYVDSIIEAMTRMKHDKPFALQALKGYLEAPDDQVVEVTYNYYSQDKITPPLPYPKAEYYSIQLEQIQNRTRQPEFRPQQDRRRLYVQSAADRKIDKS